MWDEGITPGEEWTEELSQAIVGASCFLFFVSPSAVASRHCRNEVQHALSYDRRILSLHIAPTRLSGGLELSLGASQDDHEFAFAYDHVIVDHAFQFAQRSLNALLMKLR